MVNGIIKLLPAAQGFEVGKVIEGLVKAVSKEEMFEREREVINGHIYCKIM